ncbi:MAG TPA: DUF4164 domain-containing protein [Xanthobacteraceae bacterium]|jgi:hypothetical protein|nr:DUF4164 domain-containing protein [Xanthobacteraceae bacterium]
MTDTSALEAATKRMTLALEALEAAVERRLEADRGEAAVADQLHAFDADRSRLAAELDESVARSRRLETTNREIARRLDHAIASIRSVLAAHHES